MNPSNDKQSYTISVVIPAFNAEEYIGRAIDSVLAQTRQPDEIIVVDDGSTDNTAEVIKPYSPKVHYIHQENGGASVARNTGIEAATGQWLAFLDADDEWLPEKLSMQIEHLRCNSDLVWTHSNYFVRSAVDNKQTVAFVGAGYESLLRGGDYFEDYLNVHVGLWIRTSTVVIKREI
ncbi:MAG: glycosyltransferase family 2 protein, partial [Planctomycetes bacterium]|nr:glycosyltransferase family 2 protein [Planctomycetota bacterium]